MKKQITPTLNIEVDITQPTRCDMHCPFFTAGLVTYKDALCRLFDKRLRVVKARGQLSAGIQYIHRCKECRQAEVPACIGCPRR